MSRRNTFDPGGVYQLIGQTGQLNIDPRDLVSAILADGSSGTIWRALPCPCARADTRLPAINCAHCKGTGYVYPETMREPTMFLDTSRSGSQRVNQVGMALSGTITITVAPCLTLGPGDLVRPDEDTHVVQERLWPSASNGPQHRTHDLMRAMRPGGSNVPLVLTPGRAPRILYPEVACIDAVAFTDAQDRLIVATPNDYTLGADGSFRWLPDKGPPPGQGWTVRYSAPAVYMVQSTTPVTRHQANQLMPWRVVAQRYDRVSHRDPGFDSGVAP